MVYLHGFSATRQETWPLAGKVARERGAHLFLTRSSEHGRSADAMGEPEVSDWIRDGKEALTVARRLGHRTVLIGTSTGATLAAWLATSEFADQLEALILISPNFGLRKNAAQVLTWPWGRQLARLIIGDYRSWEPHNERHARFWTTRYPSSALVTMMALVQLARDTHLGGVEVPAMRIYSEQDKVIDPKAARRAFTSLGSARKQVVRVEDSTDVDQHVLAGDILSANTTSALASKIARFVGSPNPSP